MRVQIKRHDFDSPYTDREVAQRFRQAVENEDLDNQFALSLYAGAKKYGRYTARQIPWLHVLVAQHEGRATRNEVKRTGYEKIHQHLTGCRQSRENGGKGLLHPVVSLQVGDSRVVLKLAGPKSKHNGKVSVASDHRYGFGDFYGWIGEDGEFTSQNPPQHVLEILGRVAENPEQAISEIGRESGHCCYCFAELTTVQSKMAGCGKRCAENYSVSYPNAAEVRDFVQANPEVLEGASDRERWEPVAV